MFQFSAFPYFPTDNVDYPVNRLHLFSFWRFKDKYLQNPEVRQKVERLCALYVNSELKRLDFCLLAVIDGNYSLAPLTDEQVKDVYRYGLALFFCSVIYNNSWGTCTSENFLLIRQNFNLIDDEISYTTGSIRPVTNLQDINRIHFIKPDFIESRVVPYRVDLRLFVAFANMIDAHNPDEYIFSVLEWIYYSYINFENITHESRIVMLATGFEIFFRLKRGAKAEKFAERLETLLKVDERVVFDKKTETSITGLPRTQRTDANGKVRAYGKGPKEGQPFEYTMYGWWARDFYGLRSKIVHEGTVTAEALKNHNGEPHFKIAIQIFNYCFHRLLEDRGYFIYKKSASPLIAEADKWGVESGLQDIEEKLE